MERLLLQLEMDQLNAAYAAALDEKRFDDWPGFFLEDGRYKVQARENFDRGLAACADRAGEPGDDEGPRLRRDADHLPRALLHAARGEPGTGAGAGEGGLIRAQAHYAVFRTRPGDSSEVYNVGRYIDEIVRTDAGLRFASRLCVYDSEMVLNSLIYPI